MLARPTMNKQAGNNLYIKPHKYNKSKITLLRGNSVCCNEITLVIHLIVEWNRNGYEYLKSVGFISCVWVLFQYFELSLPNHQIHKNNINKKKRLSSISYKVLKVWHYPQNPARIFFESYQESKTKPQN